MRRTFSMLAIGLGALLAIGSVTQVARVVRDMRTPPHHTFLAFVREHALRSADGPALVLLVDSECGACRRAEAELDTIEADELGVVVRVIRRGDVENRDALDDVESRPVPAYLLFDESKRLVSSRHGYVPLPDLVDWLAELWRPNGAHAVSP